jgi:hypothetical protein
VSKKKRRKQFKKYRQYEFEFHGRNLLVQGYERQALRYLVDQGFDPDDILTENEFGDTLNLRYQYRKRWRTYFPDIYIRNENIIVEVKSKHTLGLMGRKKRGWSMTCQKAIACHKRGFRFCLLLLNRKGDRIRLPKNWPYMKKQEVIDFINGEDAKTS